MDKFIDWWDSLTENGRLFLFTAVIAAVIIPIGWFVIARISESMAADERQFMAQCLQDHKQYECDILYHQLHSDSSAPAPVVIPMPTGR